MFGFVISQTYSRHFSAINSFGEILPSAIFTGPKKLELASRMVRISSIAMALFLIDSKTILSNTGFATPILDRFLWSIL